VPPPPAPCPIVSAVPRAERVEGVPLTRHAADHRLSVWMLPTICEVDPLRASVAAPSQRYASIEQLAGDLRRAPRGPAGGGAHRDVQLPRDQARAPQSRQARDRSGGRRRALRRGRGRTSSRAVRGGAPARELVEIDDAIRDVAGTTHAHTLVVTRALTNLDRLASTPDRDPELSRELAIAYMRIG